MIFGGCAETIMIKNGLYSLTATSRGGVDGEVGGVLVLHDGNLYGGDSYVYYTGSYECSDGKWQGKMTSQAYPYHATDSSPGPAYRLPWHLRRLVVERPSCPVCITSPVSQFSNTLSVPFERRHFRLHKLHHLDQ